MDEHPGQQRRRQRQRVLVQRQHQPERLGAGAGQPPRSTRSAGTAAGTGVERRRISRRRQHLVAVSGGAARVRQPARRSRPARGIVRRYRRHERLVVRHQRHQRRGQLDPLHEVQRRCRGRRGRRFPAPTSAPTTAISFPVTRSPTAAVRSAWRGRRARSTFDVFATALNTSGSGPTAIGDDHRRPPTASRCRARR